MTLSEPGTDASAILTFLIADIRGYTRFTLEQGDAAAARLAGRFADLVEQIVGEHGGRVIELRGDEALAVFSSARAALRAATALQATFLAERRDDLPLNVGIGLDAGEALPVREGYRGAALNLAARLCSLAGPGEILASETVTALARKLQGVTYGERGYLDLKGFEAPVKAMTVSGGLGPTSTQTNAQSPAGTATATAVREERPAAGQSLPIGGFLGALPEGMLVARLEERQRIEEAVQAVAAGGGRLVLLAGEAGAGKTRLAQEATLLARNFGFVVMTGRCYEPYNAVPFYPFREALATAYKAAPAAVRSQVPTRWPHLAKILPDAPFPAPPVAANSHEEQQRLLWAVAGFIQALSSISPVALLLDDLHWADASSLELLEHLARLTHDAPVLLAGTFRDAEIGSKHPLRRIMLDLEREHLVQRISVGRLSREDTGALVAATVGAEEIPPAIVDQIHVRTEGNAFFTREVLRTLVERGEIFRDAGQWISRPGAAIEIPETVIATIDQRLASVSEETQEVLVAASVLGQPFFFDDLLAMIEHSEEEIERALDEAAEAGIVRAGAGDEYVFNHALTQQALYTRLAPRRKRRLHHAAGLALEQLDRRARERRAPELAQHFLQGGDPERGLPYAILAGDAAEAVFAHGDAATHYQTALELAQHIGDDAQEARVREKLGGLLTATIQYTAALAMLEDAARMYHDVGDFDSEGRVVAQIGRLHVFDGSVAAGLARLEAYYPSQVDRGPTRALANLTSSLAYLRYASGLYAEALPTAGEAVEIARQAGDKGVCSEAESRRGATLAMLGRWSEAVQSLREALRFADGAGDVYTRCRTLQALAGIALLRGELDVSRTNLEEALSIAERMGNRRQIAVSSFGLGLRALVAGELEESATQAERALAIMRALEGSWATACQIPGLDPLVLLDAGWEHAGQYLQECASRAARGTAWHHALRVAHDLWDGRPDEAAAHLGPLLAEPLDSQQREAIRPLEAQVLLEHDLARARAIIQEGMASAEASGLKLLRAVWQRFAPAVDTRL